MNTPLSWIKDYVPDLDVTDQEYRDAMTLSGTKVENYIRRDKNLEKIVVGEILEVEKHPDAEHLIICQVNTGSETIQIVTGAPNVHKGDKVPVVLAGGKVAGSAHDDGPAPEEGYAIKEGKLRGVDSYGMMCSIDELGSDVNFYPEADPNGIYIFPADTEVGADAVEILGLHDTVVEYEVTSNRVDCFSILGIAREAAVTFGKEFKAPVVKETGNSEDVNDFISVEVQDTDLCPRYTARVVKNIKIEPSPKWMQLRLGAAGIRPINNIVDITNFVMLEYGQPMHAYDYDKISGKKIIVRRAKDGDKFVTLDGQERNLDKDVLMICDGEKEIGIAGVMGGENTMITDDVKTMLFEAATFNGTNIRKSSRRVGLRTDASGIFEKGLDPRNASEAMNRACQLVEELGAGEVVGGIVDIKVPFKDLVRIPFEPERINDLLGTSYTTDEMLDVFEKEELTYDKDSNEVIIPSFRQDLLATCDLAEEVARFKGYANIPTTLPGGNAMGGVGLKLRVEDKAREVAEMCGFSQAYVYSFESPKVFDKLKLATDAPERNAIRISNPLGEDFSVMRTISLNGMLTSLSTNYNRRNPEVKLYELGNIYVPESLPLTDYPDERMQFTLGFYGKGDFFSMKGAVEEFFNAVGMKNKREYDPKAGKPFLHPGRQALVKYEGVTVGYLGEVHPAVCAAYDIKTRVYVAVIDMPAVMEFVSFDHKYEGIAKFPAVTRDLSMLVPSDVLVGQIETIFAQRGGKILEDVKLFDVYEGEQVAKGFKSVAYSLTFRAKDKTLEDNDITAAMKKILNGLQSLGIELRS
jgi:phenylalanyl-tRNA synthetase beta chain